MTDGIEIHYDVKRQYLELACEPDAFSSYREIARVQLADFPEIKVDDVVELNIVDTATFVARRDAPKKRFWDFVIVGVVFVVLVLAAIGAVSVIRWIAP